MMIKSRGRKDDQNNDSEGEGGRGGSKGGVGWRRLRVDRQGADGGGKLRFAL